MSEYDDRMGQYKQAAEERGYPWACADCGATDRALSFYPGDGATIAKRAMQAPDWAWFYRTLAAQPLLCRACRVKRDQAAKREAAWLAVRDEQGGENA